MPTVIVDLITYSMRVSQEYQVMHGMQKPCARMEVNDNEPMNIILYNVQRGYWKNNCIIRKFENMYLNDVFFPKLDGVAHVAAYFLQWGQQSPTKKAWRTLWMAP